MNEPTTVEWRCLGRKYEQGVKNLALWTSLDRHCTTTSACEYHL